MSQSAGGGGRHAVRAGVAAALRMIGAVLARPSPSLAGPLRTLGALVAQGRDDEIRAAARRRARSLAAAVGLVGPLDGKPGGRWGAFRAVAIDAATQRLDGAGRVAPKTPCYVHPSPQAPRLVTIVIPCFNYGRFLPEAIASARAQTLACEIVVVDDGSTEELTLTLLDELERAPDLVVLRQTNQGLPGARNAGVARSRGEYVCCLDADDRLDPTYVEAALARMTSDRSAGFAYAHARLFGDVDETWRTRDFDPDLAMVDNHVSVSAVFRRDDWEIIGGYAPQMRGGYEDWEFWIRLASLGRSGRVVAAPLFLHRRHGRTMTHDALDMAETLRARIRALNPRFFADADWRSRLSRLVGPPAAEREPFARLAGALAADPRPAILALTPGLRRGDAAVAFLNILKALGVDHRIIVVTTEPEPHPARAAFEAVTGEIFHLAETTDQPARLAFLSHLVVSRGVSRVLCDPTTFALQALPTLRAARPGLRVVSFLHDETPAPLLRAAARAGTLIDRHVARSAAAAAATGLGEDRIFLAPEADCEAGSGAACRAVVLDGERPA